MPLKTREGFPPGGWQYFQPETGWRPPYPLADTFNQTVDRIIKHRQSNPRFNLPTDWEIVSNQLDVFTCARLRNNPQYCDGVKKNYLRPPAIQSSSRRNAGLAGVRALAGGARILTDWLGSGARPVEREQAQARANICLSCPNNTKGGFLVSKITKSVAMAVREQLKLKHEMDMTLEKENQLETCSICLCNLRLKPWVPTETLKEHTSQEVLKEFPEWCWVKKEIS